jgi:hypothetical protein
MSKRSLPLSIVIAIGLVAGSMIGVAAQEAPAEFTAEWGFGPTIEAGARVSDEDAVQYSGEVWRPSTVVEATDPRFRGELTNSWNHDDYPDGSNIGAITFTVRNAEGAWLMEPAMALGFPDSEYWPLLNAVFMGEDGYDGLSALVQIETADDGWQLHGYIIDEASLPTVEPYQP